MIERRHRIERVRERAKAHPDREDALAVFRRRVAGRADDPLIEEEPCEFIDAVHFGRHGDHHERTATRFDHLVRALERGGHDPIAAVDAPEFRIEERSLEVNAEAPRAGIVSRLLELVCRFRHFRGGVHHRFPGCRHDGSHVAGRAHARIRARGDVDGIALIAIEQHVVGAVGMNVDHARRDRRALGRNEVAWPVVGENLTDPAMFNGDPAVDGRSITERDARRTENE